MLYNPAVSRLRFALAFGALLLSTTPVLAQPASDGDRAIAAGHDALDLYNKASWAEARARFEEADRLMHSPVFLLYAARCARNAGDLAAAKGIYERVAAEAPPAGAPPPWVNAVTSAKEELAELVKRIVSAAPTATASTTAAAPTASASAPLPALSASLSASANAPGSGAPPAPTAPPTGPSTGPSGAPTAVLGAAPHAGSLAPGLAALGVGLVGLGAGIGLFAHAKSIANGILERCGNRPTCREDDLPNRQAAYDFAGGATGSFIGGGVLAAAGVALLIWRPFGRGAPAGQGLSVQPGPAGLRVSGSF